jgi:uroporphyrinogen decarboxylase
MNHRERIRAALRFERPDRLPCHETPWEQTLAAWRKQGLPDGVSLEDHFGFDLAFMYLDTSPRFEQRILKREGGRITYEDRFGYTLEKKEGISATLDFKSHVTSGKEAWPAVKARLALSDDPAEPARIDDTSYFAHFAPYPTWAEARRKYDRIRRTDRYMLFMVYGPWEATWRHRGMESLLIDTAVDPDWVSEMAGAYQDLVIATLGRCIDEGMRPGGVLAADDLGMKTGLLISPQSWRGIYQPAVAGLGAFLDANGIDFWLHTDGAVKPLIDMFLECGVRVLNPLEVKAGMDAVDLRRRYGRELAFFGNIDAVKMGGPRDLIEEELRRKIPLALEGGFIMHSDHSCPPEVSLERYSWILETARRIFDQGARAAP